MLFEAVMSDDDTLHPTNQYDIELTLEILSCNSGFETNVKDEQINYKTSYAKDLSLYLNLLGYENITVLGYKGYIMEDLRTVIEKDPEEGEENNNSSNIKYSKQKQDKKYNINQVRSKYKNGVLCERKKVIMFSEVHEEKIHCIAESKIKEHPSFRDDFLNMYAKLERKAQIEGRPQLYYEYCLSEEEMAMDKYEEELPILPRLLPKL
jgi:hypothetical protein